MQARLWKMLSLCLSVGCGGNTVDLGHADDWADLPAVQPSLDEPQTLFESTENVFGLTADDTTLYALITRGNSQNHADSFELVSCPIEACKSQRKSLYRGPLISDLYGRSTLHLVDGTLFWLFPQIGVASCSARGCANLVVTPANTHALASDGKDVYWLEAASALRRQGPGDADPVQVRTFSPLDVGYATQASAHGPYFHARNGDSRIYRVRKDGSNEPEPFVVDDSIAGMGVNDELLYYSSSSLAGRIVRCGLEDCAASARTVADRERWPAGIQVHGGELFWFNTKPWAHGEQSMLLASCLLPDCANVERWPAKVALPFLDAGKLYAPELVINDRYVMWVTPRPVTTGSAINLVSR